MAKKDLQPRILFGPDGEPLTKVANGNGKAKKTSVKSFSFSQLNTYLEKLFQNKWPASQRAQDPFGNHIWVFAAAMAEATVASQAPFTIYRETTQQLELRKKSYHERGMAWVGPRAGINRRAMQRYSQKSGVKRLFNKGIEPDYDSPMYNLFLKPNPFQDLRQFMQVIILWMGVRGELFNVLTDENGEPVVPGQLPAYMWPLSPDLFEPWFEYGDHGELLGWYYTPPCYMPNGGAGYRNKIPIPLHSVIQIKYPNPANPLRGLSRITAAAMGIEVDLTIRGHNLGLIKNHAVPRGALTYAGILSPEEKKAYERKWKDEYEGEGNQGKTSILANGFSYQTIGLSNADIEYIKQLEMGRDEILAAMGMPASVLGVTQYTNYATQLGQDKNFWDKLLIPMFQLIEGAFDQSIFFHESDNTFAIFDLKDVEALRAGVRDKLDGAKLACGPELHMTPEVAYEVFDIEVPEYEGRDKCLVTPMLSKVEDIITPLPVPGMVPGAPGALPVGAPGAVAPTAAPGKLPPPIQPPGASGSSDLPASAPPGSRLGDPIKPPMLNALGVEVTKAKLGWKDFVKFQSALEAPMIKDYRGWVAQMKSETMERFDRVMRDKKSFKVDLSIVLPDPDKAKNALGARTRGTRAKAIEATYNFTTQEIGPPVFEIDDDRIVDFFRQREEFFTGQVTESQWKRWEASLLQGVKNGESMKEIRLRVAHAFDISASSPKAMTIGRTESTALVNGMRRSMFAGQGFEMHEWMTAQDLVVRSNHSEYGDAGAKEMEFNYLTLSGNTGAGILAYPHDSRCGDPGETINCRCYEIAVATEKQRKWVEAMRMLDSASRRAMVLASFSQRAPVVPQVVENTLPQILQPVEIHVHNKIDAQPVPERTEQVIERGPDGKSIVKIVNIPIYK